MEIWFINKRLKQIVTEMILFIKVHNNLLWDSNWMANHTLVILGWTPILVDNKICHQQHLNISCQIDQVNNKIK